MRGQGLGAWDQLWEGQAHLFQGSAGQSHIGVDESPPGPAVSVLGIADLGRFPGGHFRAESQAGWAGPFHVYQLLPCLAPPRQEPSPFLIGRPRTNGNSPPGSSRPPLSPEQHPPLGDPGSHRVGMGEGLPSHSCFPRSVPLSKAV